ncbi:biotin/lipoyl-binding protein [Candidatus Woesearchaeota archaeon]|nr:biotin/lipoyl-binding protein [Candidatus Woesearchaeota archaeon]
MEELVVKVDGKDYKVFVEDTEEGKIIVHCEGDIYEVETKKDIEQSAIERLHKKQSIDEGKVEITAPLPGIVYDVKIKQGSNVKQGQSLFTLMAMKMENYITAPKDGKIKEIKVKKDDNVNKGDVLAVLE